MRKNVFKKYLSGLLAMLMTIGLMPVYTKPMTVQAANDVKTMNLNTSYLAPGDGTWDAGSDHKVYFGQYDGTPTAFRVLKVEDGTMMLDCDTILLTKAFDKDNSANTEQTSGKVNEWNGSDLEKWLNGTDYYGNNAVFASGEKSAILQTTLAASDTDYVIVGSEGSYYYKDYAANDYVYLLSAKEADTLYADNAARVKAGGNYCWLRSANIHNVILIGAVDPDGLIGVTGVYIDDPGVSPALNLNQDSVLFASAVDMNKSSDTLTNIQAADGTKEWKLTLLDPKKMVKVVNGVSTPIIRSGNTISVPYSHEGISAEQISVMITNGAYDEAGTEILYYGKLTEDKTSGAVISRGFFTLPDGLPAGYRIYILAEDINGEKYTDYASAPAEVTVPELVEAPIANLTEDTYTSDQSLILTSATAGADIYYTMTTDGSEPDDPDPYIPSEYNGAILLTGTVGNSTTYRIKALAAKTYTNESSISSFTYTISIPETYEVTVANGTGGGAYKEGETVTITADTPESGKQFKEWTGVDGLTFIDETDKTSQIAKFTMPANAVSVTAAYEDIPKEAVPTATVDYINESLTGLNTGAKYTVNDREYTADSNGNISIDSSWIGTTVKIIKTASDANHLASEAQSLVIPARPATPNVQGVNTSYADTMDGKITGVTTAMEYRKSTGGTWTSCAVDEVTGLEAGTYEVRVKASDSSFAGLVTNVTIAVGPARTYTLTVTAPKFENVHYGYAQPTAKPITITSSGNSDTTITSVTIDGTNFTITEGTSPVTAGEKNETYKIQPIAGLEAGVYSATITVTYQNGTATVTDEVSIIVEKAEQQAPAAPTVASHTKDSITLTNTPDSIESGAKAEYSKDNGNTWQDSPVFEGLNGTAAYNFVVRYRANGNYNVSANSEVLTAKISHSYTNSVTQEATCQEKGIRTYTCSCGDSYTETIAVNPNNHDLGHYEEKAPTYTEIGWNAYDECRRIGCGYTTYQELPKLVDNIAPTGEITAGINHWKDFIHTITFGIFAKDKFDVTITAEDKETGVKSVEYICSETPISETDILTVVDWKNYSAFGLAEEGKYIVYAKITDNSNNITYISSNGMVVDRTVPVIDNTEYAITAGGDQTIKKNFDGTVTITCNGELSKFISVSIDGTKVDSKNYTLKSGSTILTFTKEYIASLAMGTHAVRFEYIDGYAETKLTIAKADDTNNKNPTDKPNQDKDVATDEKKPTTEASPLESPKTDENAPLGCLIIVFVSSLVGAIVIEAYRRKTKAE